MTLAAPLCFCSISIPTILGSQCDLCNSGLHEQHPFLLGRDASTRRCAPGESLLRELVKLLAQKYELRVVNVHEVVVTALDVVEGFRRGRSLKQRHSLVVGMQGVTGSVSDEQRDRRN